MGIYAQTNYQIEISGKNKKEVEATAKKVITNIKKLSKNDKDNNNFGEQLAYENDKESLDSGTTYVYGFMSSGRIQNLEWRCEQIWEAIKDIKGVISLDCPFLSEADGYYQSKEE